MKTGRCPVCCRRLVLVRHAHCGCGQGHRLVIQRQGDNCPLPVFAHLVRTHDCGSLLQPTEIKALSA